MKNYAQLPDSQLTTQLNNNTQLMISQHQKQSTDTVQHNNQKEIPENNRTRNTLNKTQEKKIVVRGQ